MALLSLVRAGAATASAANYAVLHNFTSGKFSAEPLAPLLAVGGNTFFGTSTAGGNSGCARFGSTGCGTVFQLTRAASSPSGWTETVLFRFPGGKGPWFPLAGLTPGPGGVLYGTTVDSLDGDPFECVPGDYCGTAFQLAPPASRHGNWTETDLFRFNGQTDGVPEFSGLVSDGKGNLYGTTCELSASFHGTVFELTPPLNGKGWWTKTVLHTFVTDGACPSGNVVFDGNGNVYGATIYGGSNNVGVIYKLAPPINKSGIWKETVLYNFGINTCWPNTNLIFDATGNLYGTARGCPQLPGAVFELSPPKRQGGHWTETLPVVFFGKTSITPNMGLVFDRAGNIYGTTANGGTSGHGTLFQLKRSGMVWTETVLHSFDFGTGYIPGAGPVFGADGALYGTTWKGGSRGGPCKADGCGVVFRITP
ncbi:MAG: hypothetical protein JO043_07590 [Candidatus Eremiobacteraeota bacterium]|nr:hypothetical protein [Candidatus Eremiobacteraeota bacterium]